MTVKYLAIMFPTKFSLGGIGVYRPFIRLRTSICVYTSSKLVYRIKHPYKLRYSTVYW